MAIASDAPFPAFSERPGMCGPACRFALDVDWKVPVKDRSEITANQLAINVVNDTRAAIEPYYQSLVSHLSKYFAVEDWICIVEARMNASVVHDADKLEVHYGLHLKFPGHPALFATYPAE